MKLFQKWIWINGKEYKTKDDWKRKFERLKKLNFHGVLISSHSVETIGSLAKQFELEFHIWFITLINNNLDLINKHPEWYQVNKNGTPCIKKPPYVDYYKWLCPSNNEVMLYLEQEIEYFCKSEADGIHLDYIRFPDVILPDALQTHYGIVQKKEFPKYDFCYCSVCLSKFKAQYDIDILKTKSRNDIQQWTQYRLETINNLISSIRKVTDNYGKKLSAAVFPTSKMSVKMVRQQWNKWNLDIYFPMIYHNFYNKSINWIESITRNDINDVGDNSSIISGIYIPKIAPKEINNAIQAVKNGKAHGISFFDDKSMTNAHWERLKKYH